MNFERYGKIICLVLALQYIAQAQAEDVATYGVGTKYCSDFVSSVESSGLPTGKTAKINREAATYVSEKAIYISYAYGMITVLNGEAIQGFGDLKQVREDLGTLLEASLMKYCRENPSEYFMTSVYFFRNRTAK